MEKGADLQLTKYDKFELLFIEGVSQQGVETIHKRINAIREDQLIHHITFAKFLKYFKNEKGWENLQNTQSYEYKVIEKMQIPVKKFDSEFSLKFFQFHLDPVLVEMTTIYSYGNHASHDDHQHHDHDVSQDLANTSFGGKEDVGLSKPFINKSRLKMLFIAWNHLATSQDKAF